MLLWDFRSTSKVGRTVCLNSCFLFFCSFIYCFQCFFIFIVAFIIVILKCIFVDNVAVKVVVVVIVLKQRSVTAGDHLACMEHTR